MPTTTRLFLGYGLAVADFRTADGATRTLVAVPGLGSPTVGGVACGGGKFVLVAFTGGNGTSQSFSSANGLGKGMTGAKESQTLRLSVRSQEELQSGAWSPRSWAQSEYSQ